MKTISKGNFLLVFGAGIVLQFGLLNQCSLGPGSGQRSTALQSNNSDARVDQVDPEEYLIYSIILSDERYIDGKTKQVVIESRTFGNTSVDESVSSSMIALSPETVENYEVKKSLNSLLGPHLKIRVPYTLISKEEVDKIFQGSSNGWQMFYSKFPGAKGLIHLSRVGFNSERTQALVNVGIGCDWICGDEHLLLLIKHDSEWKVKSQVLTSVS